MRVAFVTPELSPFAKEGKLANFSSALPKHLAALGIDISIFLPKYRTPEIESLAVETVCPELWVPLGGDKIKASVYKGEAGGQALYFIGNPKYFLRDKIYGPESGDYLDNDERFTFFCRAVPEFLLQTGLGVDVIHSNHWPTALIPVFLKTHYAAEPLFHDVAAILTLHDPVHHGEFPAESLSWTELNWDFFTPQKLSLNGKFNFLKAGLVFSDLISLVETGSSKRSQTERFGPGLNEILKTRKDVCFRIRNGNGYKNYVKLYLKALELKRGGHIVH
jgi:starch synthase